MQYLRNLFYTPHRLHGVLCLCLDSAENTKADVLKICKQIMLERMTVLSIEKQPDTERNRERLKNCNALIDVLKESAKTSAVLLDWKTRLAYYVMKFIVQEPVPLFQESIIHVKSKLKAVARILAKHSFYSMEKILTEMVKCDFIDLSFVRKIGQYNADNDPILLGFAPNNFVVLDTCHEISKECMEWARNKNLSSREFATVENLFSSLKNVENGEFCIQSEIAIVELLNLNKNLFDNEQSDDDSVEKISVDDIEKEFEKNNTAVSL
jgi:hypothetical protein